MRLLTLALALTATCIAVAASAAAHAAPNCGRLSARAELSCAHTQLHTARAELSSSRRLSASGHSASYWRWRERVARRWIAAASWRIAHPPIPHLALWLCIHSYEGAWNDDTGNSFYGGLQMTENWGPYGHPLVWHANLLSPYGQMRVAEEGYAIVTRTQGYSYARNVWLPGQWHHPACFVYR